MIREAAASVALLLILAATPAAAAAGTNVESTEDAFAASGTATQSSPNPEHTSAATQDPEGYELPFSCDGSGLPQCASGATCDNGMLKVVRFLVRPVGDPIYLGSNCPGESAKPSVTDVEHAFKEIPMQPSVIHIQPPHGETLVNFDSIFYTDPFTLDVTKRPLGVPVAFHITVQKYIWLFGDGSSLTTTDAGAAYPDQTIVHRYLKKGPVSVTLETVYQADYSIDGGAQQHLADTVTRASPPQQLTVLTATPHLVAD